MNDLCKIIYIDGKPHTVEVRNTDGSPIICNHDKEGIAFDIFLCNFQKSIEEIFREYQYKIIYIDIYQ